MISKIHCGFNRHQPLLKSLSVTPRFAFSVYQCFTGPSKGNFFVIARSASGWVRVRVLLLEFVSTFFFVLYPPSFRLFAAFVHFLPCFYRVDF